MLFVSIAYGSRCFFVFARTPPGVRVEAVPITGRVRAAAPQPRCRIVVAGLTVRRLLCRDIEDWLNAQRELGEGAGQCQKAAGSASVGAQPTTSAPRRRGIAKIDCLNAAGLPASVLVARALSTRVQRVTGRHHSAQASPGGVPAQGSLLGELVQDERVHRMQVVLKLLLGAGAELAQGGVRRQQPMGRSSAADVIHDVMRKMSVALISFD